MTDTRPETRARDPRWRWAAVLFLAAFVLNALYSANVHSGVCDELAAHIPAGHLYWTTGVYSGGVGNFPLVQLLIALPVRLLGLPYALFTEQHLFLFRLPVILLGIVLGIAIWFFTRRLAGEKAALVALFLFSFSPNMLAHASLATLDFPLAAFVFLALFALFRYAERPSPLNGLLLGAALGAALGTKVQALLLLPLLLVVLPARCPVLFRALKVKPVATVLSLAGIALVPWLLINALYRHVPLAGGHLLPPGFMAAVTDKLVHARTGHSAYLLGQYSDRGWWYYFPVAVAVKTPLPVLVLLAIGVVRRPSRDMCLCVILPACAFLAAAMAARVNIGLRHVLMLYPLLFVFAGAGAAAWWERSWRGVMLALLAATYLAESVLIAPHFLSYFNALAGGPARGHRVLLDSNYDWGQNDRFLRDYLEKTGIAAAIDPHPFRPTGGRVIVNANALYGLLNEGSAAYAWLKEFEPVNRIAYTWFEYEVPGPRISFPDRAGRLEGEAAGFLLALREKYADAGNAEYRMSLVKAFVAVRDYPEALEQVRRILARDPAQGAALALGGELVVWWKLGILHFEGTEYLYGFPARAPAPSLLSDDAFFVRLAGDSRLADAVGRVLNDLGVALWQERRDGEAVEMLRRAIGMRPGFYEAGNNLAWMLATSPDDRVRDAREAVHLAELVCRAAGESNPQSFDTLAAAYAEAGRFEEAVAAARRAAGWAESTGASGLAAEMGMRLQAYRSGRAWRDTRGE